jgi:hypothetical protein
MRFTATLSYKYASDEASQDNCELFLSFCESNDALPRAPFTVWRESSFLSKSFFAILQLHVIVIV